MECIIQQEDFIITTYKHLYLQIIMTFIESLELICFNKGICVFLSYISSTQASQAMLLLNGKYIKSPKKLWIARPAKSPNDKISIDKYISLIQWLIGNCPYD